MALQGAKFDEDYARLTGKGGGDEKPGDPEVILLLALSGTFLASPTPGRPFGFPKPGPGGGGDQSQNVFQDNDITNTITGDNNTVENTQDNSIRQSMGSSDYSSRYARGLKDKYVLNLLNR